MKRRMFAVVGTVAAAALIAAGCGSDENGGSGGAGGSDEFNGDMKVGAIVPLTGDLQAFGEAGEAALQLATEVANDAIEEAGYDGKVELVVEDGETREDAATSAAEQLVNEDVSCIVGDWASSSTQAVAQSVTIDEGVPLISPASTAGEISTLDDDGTVFRTVPSDNLQAEVLAQAISEDLGGSGTVTVAARNNAYGSGLASAFVEAGEAAGLTVEEPILMDPDAPRAAAEASEITSGEEPDAFLIIDYPDAFLKLGPELVKTGKWDPAKTWGSDGMRDETLPETGGAELTEGMRGTAPTADEAPAADAFDTLWNEGERPDRQTYDADNFDALMACVLAAFAAGSADPQDVAEQLQDVSGGGESYTFENMAEAIEAAANGDDVDYQGAASPLDWDENGDPTSAFYEIWAYRNGGVETLEVVPFGDAAESGEGGSEGDSTTEGTETESTETETTETEATETEGTETEGTETEGTETTETTETTEGAES